MIYTLNGLGKEYESFVVPLTQRKEPLTFNELYGMLLNHERRVYLPDASPLLNLAMAPPLANYSAVTPTASDSVTQSPQPSPGAISAPTTQPPPHVLQVGPTSKSQHSRSPYSN